MIKKKEFSSSDFLTPNDRLFDAIQGERYTPAELAKYMRVSPYTVYQWVKIGLPVYRTGRNSGRISIYKSDFEKWYKQTLFSGRSHGKAAPQVIEAEIVKK